MNVAYSIHLSNANSIGIFGNGRRMKAAFASFTCIQLIHLPLSQRAFLCIPVLRPDASAFASAIQQPPRKKRKCTQRRGTETFPTIALNRRGSGGTKKKKGSSMLHSKGFSYKDKKKSAADEEDPCRRSRKSRT